MSKDKDLKHIRENVVEIGPVEVFAEHKQPCGCIVLVGDTVEIEYCKKHRSAPIMLEALRWLESAANADGWPDGWGEVKDKMEVAIEKATGR